MNKELCLIHANCQGDAIKELLEANPQFSSRFTIRHLRNYKREALEQGLLDKTTLFLYQHLTAKWGELSTSQVLARLPSSTHALCIPNCFFKGYWPFWEHRPEIIEFYDSLLENFLAREPTHSLALKLYLTARDELLGDLEKNAADSIAREKEKEIFTPIKYVHLIEERWREEQMFLTINHPGPLLLGHIVQEILKRLELPLLPDDFIKAYNSPHNEFWLPIHPRIGLKLKLPFASTKRCYSCFGANLTHEEYCRLYIACRENNFKDLPSALASHASFIRGASSGKDKCVG